MAARFADRIAAMCAGRLAGIGTPGDVITPGVVCEIFGVQAALSHAPDGHPIITPIRPM